MRAPSAISQTGVSFITFMIFIVVIPVFAEAQSSSDPPVVPRIGFSVGRVYYANYVGVNGNLMTDFRIPFLTRRVPSISMGVVAGASTSEALRIRSNGGFLAGTLQWSIKTPIQRLTVEPFLMAGQHVTIITGEFAALSGDALFYPIFQPGIRAGVAIGSRFQVMTETGFRMVFFDTITERSLILNAGMRLGLARKR